MTGTTVTLRSTSATASVSCPGGGLAVGGGAQVHGAAVLKSSYPSDASTWTVEVVPEGDLLSRLLGHFRGQTPTVTPYATCIAPEED